MKMIVAIPAAGESSRMRGRDKLLEVVNGEPLLRSRARIALGLGFPVHVFVRKDDPERRKALADLDVKIVVVDNAAQGMSATLRAAAGNMPADHALMLLLPDVPGVGENEVHAIVDAFDGKSVTRASDPQGLPGTPIIFPSVVVPEFNRLSGDDGGRSILRDRQVKLVKFDDDRATRDLDTPEEWRAWRANRSNA